MKTLKRLLTKSKDPYETLLAYLTTPLANGYSPAKLIMGRKLRTGIRMWPTSLNPEWSHLEPARKTQKRIKQRQKQSFDRRHRAGALRRLAPDEHVSVTDMDRRGTVMSEVGRHAPRSYIVRTRVADVR